MTESFQSGNQFVLLSLNPKSGRRSSAERASILSRNLEARGFTVETHMELDEVTSRANQLRAQGLLHALVGVGGDGTAAELVNRTERDVPITLLPSGTANLIAKRFRLPFAPEAAAEMIAQGSSLSLDAGRANGRLFLAMASAGLDAEIVRRVHATREKKYRQNTNGGAHINYLSYLKPLLQSVRNYEFPSIATEYYASHTSTPEVTLGNWSLVFNLPNYAWGVRLAPECDEADGKLDYCVFSGGGFPATLSRVALAHLWGAHRLLPSVRLGRGERFVISVHNENAATNAIPYQLDGDPGGVLPVEITVEPGRFTLIAPSDVITRVHERHGRASKSI